MTQNVGIGDSFIRMFLGLLIVGLGFFYQSWLGLIALLPLVTAFASYCPVYKALGISTHRPHTAAH